jgi:hypothetical protein
MNIENMDSFTLLSSNSHFKLEDILHCPAASTSLMSIHQFGKGNDCFFMLTTSHYFVKDNQIMTILLNGRSKNELHFQKAPLKNKGSFTTFLRSPLLYGT